VDGDEGLVLGWQPHLGGGAGSAILARPSCPRPPAATVPIQILPYTGRRTMRSMMEGLLG
jgi:hypothetical protein